MMQNESQWVKKRRELVEDFVQGRTIVAALLSNRQLGQDTLLAMRDEIKELREHLNPTRRDGDGDAG